MSLHDFGLPLTYSDEKEPPKAELISTLQADQEAWLKTHTITQVPRGATGLPQAELPAAALLAMSAKARREYYRKRNTIIDMLDLDVQDQHTERLARLESEI